MTKKTTKASWFKVRVDAEEDKAFRVFCQQMNVTPSEAMRRFMRQASGLGPSCGGVDRAAIYAYTRQLRAIGVNLNQIARILNSGRTPDFATLEAGIGMLIVELAAQSEDYISLCERTRQQAVEVVSYGY